MVTILLGLLATAGFATYRNWLTQAKDAATRAALDAMRAGIATWRAANFGDDAVRSDVPPTTAQVSETGVNSGSQIMLPPGDIPDSPWHLLGGGVRTLANADRVEGVASTVVFGTVGTGFSSDYGWRYKPTTGQIWANSNVNGENLF